MKLIALCLALVSVLCAADYAALQYAAFRDDTLRAGSLFCTNRAAYEEGTQALAAGDSNWLERLQACTVTEFPNKARAIGCDAFRCEIRLWFPSGDTATGFASFRNLSLTP